MSGMATMNLVIWMRYSALFIISFGSQLKLFFFLDMEEI